ncbi:MAG: YdbL family protein [Oceanipulchritudo sp.]|jgi:uncharacterized protein YdbL (DUF1318 family)
MKTIPYTLIGLLFFNAFLCCLAAAEPATEATGRMKERLAQVDQLKASGAAGEDARGYLAAREPLGPRQSMLVEQENADRRIVYTEVARRTDQTLEEVGRQRAIQIAARASPGVWLQKPNGEWYRK